METALALTLLVLGVIMLLASLDDLVVDILCAFRLCGQQTPILPAAPLPATGDDPGYSELPSIAVFVANWHEADVLGAMVDRNLRNFTYPRVKFVLGVYPNDTETKSVAMALAEQHPDHVQVIVNRRAGPTSKGQMLNEMFAQVFAKPAAAPDLVVMHDSEDVIATRSFEVYAREYRDHAMIQIPIFSLDSRHRSLVAATYMEEFAERHTLELRLREDLGAFIPSAGVGTCLRKDLICHFIKERDYVLQPGSVTEDYILGAEAHRAGFSTRFAAYRNGEDPKGSLIATLEYFPKDFWASVRQRTRWTYGIGFEGAKRLGWFGSAWNRFFLYRDRKGVVANVLPLVSFALLLACLVVGPDTNSLADWQRDLLLVVLGINSASILLRILQKSASLRRVYGFYDLLGLVARWPMAILINAIAVGRAWRSFVVESALASKPVAWAKTTHELPENFAVAKVGTLAAKAIHAAAHAGSRAHIGLRLQTYAGGAVALASMALIITGGLKLTQSANGPDVLAVARNSPAVMSEHERQAVHETAAALAELALAASASSERAIVASATPPTATEIEIMIAEASSAQTSSEETAETEESPFVAVADGPAVRQTAAALAGNSITIAALGERNILQRMEAAPTSDLEQIASAGLDRPGPDDVSSAESSFSSTRSGEESRSPVDLENERQEIAAAVTAAMAEAQVAEETIIRLAAAAVQDSSPVNTGAIGRPTDTSGVAILPEVAAAKQAVDVVALATQSVAAAEDADKAIQVRLASADRETGQSAAASALQNSKTVSNFSRKHAGGAKSAKSRIEKRRTADKQLKQASVKKGPSAISKKAIKLASKLPKSKPSTFLRRRCRDAGCGASVGPVTALPAAWWNG